VAHGTTYSAIKSLLVSRLTARSALNGVKVNYQPPSDPLDVQSLGSREAIWFTDADGTFDNVVFCDGGLRFDEDIIIGCVIQVLGKESLDDQEQVDQRVEELLLEVLAEIADPDFRVAVEQTDPVLSAFDYVLVSVATQEWRVGRLAQTGKAHAGGCELGISVQSRRSYP
jgi:hypothetical protein